VKSGSDFGEGRGLCWKKSFMIALRIKTVAPGSRELFLSRQAIDLDQTYHCAAALTGDGRGVSPWFQRLKQCRLRITLRSETDCLYLVLLTLFPVTVTSNNVAIAVV
jgi:hypothetical protein